MIVAELRVVPVGAGSSMEETVDAVCEALDDCEVHYEVGPVATTFEVDDVEDLMETVQCCQEAAIETAPRIILSLTIDERRDAEETMSTLKETAKTTGRGGAKEETRKTRRRPSRESENPRATAKAMRHAKLASEGAPRRG